MAFKITINGKEILTDKKDGTNLTSYEDARRAVASVMTTSNPLAEGILKSLDSLPLAPAAFAELMGKAGTAEDVIEVSEKPQGKNDWTLKARYPRFKFVAKLGIVLSRENYIGEIFTGETVKSSDTNVVKGEITADMLA